MRRGERHGRARRRELGALVAVMAAVTLGACGVTPRTEAAPTKTVTVLPKGAEIVHPSPPSASTSCDATASLPPPATMPTPGQMPKGSYMAQIQARGYLKVGVDQNTYLWGYRDPVTGGYGDDPDDRRPAGPPLSSRIIRAVNAFDDLVGSSVEPSRAAAASMIRMLAW